MEKNEKIVVARSNCYETSTLHTHLGEPQEIAHFLSLRTKHRIFLPYVERMETSESPRFPYIQQLLRMQVLGSKVNIEYDTMNKHI